ncbi:hypothetical protein QAD02_007645 [Eretmocerus hayati]|uniref:Uncharacterized protein n=1 Tax=Eretmocerus hayati TaxID=131215 RepID=A0ACC2N4X6_9HYME|nr:hypothetical protein QAD02_007645 [Eretmocerus hayati]
MGKQRKIFQRPHSMSQFEKKVDSNVMVPKAELNEGDNESSMSKSDSPLSQGVKTVQDKLNNENRDCNVEVGLFPKYMPQIDLTCDQLDVFASSLSITIREKIMEKSGVKEPDFMNTNEYFNFLLLDRTGIINVLVRGDTIGGIYDKIKVNEKEDKEHIRQNVRIIANFQIKYPVERKQCGGGKKTVWKKYDVMLARLED